MMAMVIVTMQDAQQADAGGTLLLLRCTEVSQQNDV
jgi:hypothetical protein